MLNDRIWGLGGGLFVGIDKLEFKVILLGRIGDILVKVGFGGVSKLD